MEFFILFFVETSLVELFARFGEVRENCKSLLRMIGFSNWITNSLKLHLFDLERHMSGTNGPNASPFWTQFMRNFSVRTLKELKHFPDLCLVMVPKRKVRNRLTRLKK